MARAKHKSATSSASVLSNAANSLLLLVLLLCAAGGVDASSADAPLAPHVKWAQRKNRLMLKIVENGIAGETVEIHDHGLRVSFEAGTVFFQRAAKQVKNAQFWKFET